MWAEHLGVSYGVSKLKFARNSEGRLYAQLSRDPHEGDCVTFRIPAVGSPHKWGVKWNTRALVVPFR